MMERSYTIAEIDALRSTLENEYLYGRYNGPRSMSGWSRSYKESEMAMVIEARLRTLMLAGLTAEEIRAQEKERERAADEAFQVHKEQRAQGIEGRNGGDSADWLRSRKPGGRRPCARKSPHIERTG